MDALFIVLTLFLGFHCVVIHQLTRWERRERARRPGIVVTNPEALERTGEVVGHYRDTPIYGSLGFRGTAYEFAGVVPLGVPQRIAENELYLAPGLLYLASSR